MAPEFFNLPGGPRRAVSDATILALLREENSPYSIFMAAYKTFMKARDAYLAACDAYFDARAAYSAAMASYASDTVQAIYTFQTAVAVAFLSGNYGAITQAQTDLENALAGINAAREAAQAAWKQAVEAFDVAQEAWRIACQRYSEALAAYSAAEGATSGRTVTDTRLLMLMESMAPHN